MQQASVVSAATAAATGVTLSVCFMLEISGEPEPGVKDITGDPTTVAWIRISVAVLIAAVLTTLSACGDSSTAPSPPSDLTGTWTGQVGPQGSPSALRLTWVPDYLCNRAEGYILRRNRPGLSALHRAEAHKGSHVLLDCAHHDDNRSSAEDPPRPGVGLDSDGRARFDRCGWERLAEIAPSPNPEPRVPSSSPEPRALGVASMLLRLPGSRHGRSRGEPQA